MAMLFVRRSASLLRAHGPVLRQSMRSLSTTANTKSVVEIQTAMEFEDLCVKASNTPPPIGGPVVVDFYADWCGPCKQLTPKLTSLVEGAQGAVRLAKVDVDKLPEIAQALQIKSLPTVILLHQAKIVDSFQGVVPDAQLKAFIDKAIGLAGGAAVGPRALEEAAALLEAGDVPSATAGYADLLALPELAARARAGLAMCALKDEPPNIALAQEFVNRTCEPAALVLTLLASGSAEHHLT